MAPGKNPIKAFGPKRKPSKNGVTVTYNYTNNY
jgi:hypothetical protein